MFKSIGPTEILVLIVPLVLVGAFVWWLLCLISAVSKPEAQWLAAGQNKIVFVLLLVFLGVIGAALYQFIALPALRRVGASGQ